MWGSSPFGSTPFATVPGPDLSVLPPFLELLENPDAERRLLLDCDFWDPVYGVVRKVGIGAGDDFDERTFGPHLVDALNFETRLFDSLGTIQLAGSPTTGDVAIAFGDGTLDYLCRWSPQGRRLRILMGGVDFTLGQFQEIFVGTAQHATWSRGRYSIALRDPSTLVDVPLQTVTFAGTGGLEGPADLKGTVKPKKLGPFWNDPAVCIDRAARVYQIHHGELNSLDAAFDGGGALTFDGNVGGYAALMAWTPVALSGTWRSCLALGLARLADEPKLLPTFNGTGDKAGGVYVDTAAGIVRRIFQAQGGLPDSALDLASFADLDFAAPARITCAVNGPASLLSVVDAVLASVFGWRTFTRTGLIAVGRFELTTPVATIGAGDVVDEHDVLELGTERPELPYYRRSLGYRRSIAVQGDGELLSDVVVTAAQRSFVGQEFRRATWEDLGVKVPNPLAESIDLDTLLADEAAAEAEADRQGALLGTLRNLYTVSVKNWQFRLRLGQTVTFWYPRFGLDVGMDCVIVRLVENTSTRTTTLTLWGSLG